MNEYRYASPGAGATSEMWVKWFYTNAGRSVTPRHELWPVSVAAMDVEMAHDPNMTAERAGMTISKAVREWLEHRDDSDDTI